MIQRENRDRVAIVRFTHGKANAIDLDFLHQFRGTLEDLKESTIESVVLVGTGSIFSAGIDLRQLLAGGSEYIKTLVPAFSGALEQLFFFPKPVVAAINGHAIAGGCIVACACDYRLLAEGKARLGIPELRVGVPFPVLALEIMRAILPPQMFQDVVYTGGTYEGRTALELGLVDAIVAPDALLDEAVKKAADLAALSAPAFRLTKEQIRQPVRDSWVRGSPGVESKIVNQWLAPETRAAIERYVAETLG